MGHNLGLRKPVSNCDLNSWSGWDCPPHSIAISTLSLHLDYSGTRIDFLKFMELVTDICNHIIWLLFHFSRCLHPNMVKCCAYTPTYVVRRDKHLVSLLLFAKGLLCHHFFFSLCRFILHISLYINLEILRQVVLLCYPFLWLRLYLHLFKQRRSKLGKHHGKKRRWRFKLLLGPINYLISSYFGHTNSYISFHSCVRAFLIFSNLKPFTLKIQGDACILPFCLYFHLSVIAVKVLF